MEKVKKTADCWKCTTEDCLHREAFRRHPREIGGLDLCPGFQGALDVKEDFQRMLSEGRNPISDFTEFVDVYLCSCSTTREIANLIVEDMLYQLVEQETL